jgi:xylulokinase
MRRLLLGLDIGSSSVKTCILDADSGQALASKAFPEVEMPIHSPQTGWAEQDPELWWTYVKQ